MTPAELGVVIDTMTRIAQERSKGMVAIFERVDDDKTEGHIFGNKISKLAVMEAMLKSLNITRWQLLKLWLTL